MYLLLYSHKQKERRTKNYTRGGVPLRMAFHTLLYIIQLYRAPVNLQFSHQLKRSFKNFNNIVKADIDALDTVEGIGETRAKAIKNGLRRIRDQIFLQNDYTDKGML